MAHDSASTPHRRPRVLAGNASHHKAGSYILEGGGENGYAVTIRSQNFPSLFSWEANLNVVDDGSTYTASEAIPQFPLIAKRNNPACYRKFAKHHLNSISPTRAHNSRPSESGGCYHFGTHSRESF